MIIWLIFFLFLQTIPSFSPLFAWSQLDISAISYSVSAISEGYQLNYCWVLKLLSGPRIFKLLNLCGNQLISWTASRMASSILQKCTLSKVPTVRYPKFWWWYLLCVLLDIYFMKYCIFLALTIRVFSKYSTSTV